MSGHVGVYERNGIWWYRVGRSIRRSSGSRNVEDALALRANAIAVENNQQADTDWKRHVREQANTSRDWLRRTHASIQKRTRLRGWASHLTMDELTQILLASKGLCALTGIPFRIDAPKRDPFSISVDRIDSSLGYSYGNVRLVLLAVNLAMSHWGEEALMTISRALVSRELQTMLHTTSHRDLHSDASTRIRKEHE
jgi:hypothetical protein